MDKTKLQTDFISYIAHELRAPLASMRWNTEMLLDGTLGDVPEAQKKILNAIYEGNKRMGTLINNLLEITHTENGKYAITNEEIHIALIVDNILHNLEKEIKEKNLKVEKDFPTNPALFSFDKKSIEIFLNTLIANAVLYNKKNGTVKISFKYNDDLLIDVTDTGIGIPEDEQKKIGTEMFRGAGVKNDTQGTGLSLLLTNKILKLTGGELTFKSVEKEGSTFSLKLPNNKI